MMTPNGFDDEGSNTNNSDLMAEIKSARHKAEMAVHDVHGLLQRTVLSVEEVDRQLSAVKSDLSLGYVRKDVHAGEHRASDLLLVQLGATVEAVRADVLERFVRIEAGVLERFVRIERALLDDRDEARAATAATDARISGWGRTAATQLIFPVLVACIVALILWSVKK